MQANAKRYMLHFGGSMLAQMGVLFGSVAWLNGHETRPLVRGLVALLPIIPGLVALWAVMVFYPGDHTPGCTAQLQDMQERYRAFLALGAQVYGVNPAEQPSHQAFAEKFGLQFPLLTDRGGVVARNFRAAVQTPVKTLILRSVYLVNPVGRIRLANRGAPPAAAILRSIEALQQATREGM